MKLSFRHLVSALFGLWLLQCNSTVHAFTLPELGLGPLPIPSNAITDSVTLETQVKPVTTAVGTHLQSVFRGFLMPGRGDGAGAGDGGFQSFWLNSSSSEFENTFSRTAFDGTSRLVLAGVDFGVAENVLLGIAIGSEKADIDTEFNLGNQEIEGTTISPYFGWLMSDNLSIDLSLGKTDTDTDQHRTFHFFGVLPGPVLSDIFESVTSSPSGEREYTALNLNGFWASGNWHFGGRLGHLSVTNDQDAYVESNGTEVASSSVELKQTQIAGDIAYGGGSSQAFFGLTYLKDSSSDEIVFDSGEQPSDDDNGLLLALGWRYYGREGVSAVFELNKMQDRDDYSEESISFTMRKDFD